MAANMAMYAQYNAHAGMESQHTGYYDPAYAQVQQSAHAEANGHRQASGKRQSTRSAPHNQQQATSTSAAQNGQAKAVVQPNRPLQTPNGEPHHMESLQPAGESTGESVPAVATSAGGGSKNTKPESLPGNKKPATERRSDKPKDKDSAGTRPQAGQSGTRDSRGGAKSKQVVQSRAKVVESASVDVEAEVQRSKNGPSRKDSRSAIKGDSRQRQPREGAKQVRTEPEAPPLSLSSEEFPSLGKLATAVKTGWLSPPQVQQKEQASSDSKPTAVAPVKTKPVVQPLPAPAPAATEATPAVRSRQTPRQASKGGRVGSSTAVEAGGKRTRGIVLWFDDQKHFGFIKPESSVSTILSRIQPTHASVSSVCEQPSPCGCRQHR
eukprot:SAG11_NODE_2465_length_3324_cov_2.765964_4_plen_380_part_00